MQHSSTSLLLVPLYFFKWRLSKGLVRKTSRDTLHLSGCGWLGICRVWPQYLHPSSWQDGVRSAKTYSCMLNGLLLNSNAVSPDWNVLTIQTKPGELSSDLSTEFWWLSDYVELIIIENVFPINILLYPLRSISSLWELFPEPGSASISLGFTHARQLQTGQERWSKLTFCHYFILVMKH